MAITVTVTPGKVFGSTETVDNDKLNQLGQPSFVITGTVANTDLADASVTSIKSKIDAWFYATSSFAANVYTLTSATAGTAGVSVADGVVVCFKAIANNTGATSITFLGVTKKVLRNKTEPLIAGDIVTGQMVEMRYDTASDGGTGAWQMMNAAMLLDVYRTTFGGSGGAYTATITPPTGAGSAATLTELAGRLIVAKVNVAASGADTLTLTLGTTAYAAINIRKNGNLALAAGDLIANQEIILAYETTGNIFHLLSPVANVITSTGIVGDSRNLVIKNNTATPNSKLDITADEVIVKTAAGTASTLRNVSLTFDFATSVGNPNGLDNGVEAASTWYYIYIIYNGTTVASLLSVNSVSPTLTASALQPYTYYALVGAVRNNAASNFVLMSQTDRNTCFPSTASVTATTASGSWEILAGTNLTGLDTSFRALVPPIARSCSGTIGTIGGGFAVQSGISAVNTDGSVDVTNLLGKQLIIAGNSLLFENFIAAGAFNVPVRGGANYNIQWRAVAASGANQRIEFSAYTF